MRSCVAEYVRCMLKTISSLAIMLNLCTINACANGTLGLNLSRAPWDPYPWVSGVQADSNAYQAGVCIGDTLLQLNGSDVLGLRISELATRLREHWKTGAAYVTMLMWRQKSNIEVDDDEEASHAVQHGINQQSLQKFATCLQHIAQLLECPVCLEVIKPPGWQCCNGHVLCNNCRSRSVKCPVCRVPLGPRGRCLLSDKLFTLLAENFPCDGVRRNKESSLPTKESNINKLSSVNCPVVNKCSTEYHSQPKVALSKSNLSKQVPVAQKRNNKIYRQLQLEQQPKEGQFVTVIEAGQELVHPDEIRQERIVEEIVKSHVRIPKGNEQNARIYSGVSNVIKQPSPNSVEGLARCIFRVQQEQQEQKQCLVEILNTLTTDTTVTNTNGLRQGEELEQKDGYGSNNMLVKPKLKLSKKSWQITDQDQDELCTDEAANINNSQQQTQQVSEQVLGPSRGQRQYQNYHCSTGKSCTTKGNYVKLIEAHVVAKAPNKLSTFKQNAPSVQRMDATTKLSLKVTTRSANSGSNSCLKASSNGEEPQELGRYKRSSIASEVY